ncbi:hypothetical protein EW145_g6660 [Phellinidium pouzarii]|uniref:tRNA (guanine(46)-N(7))-methyltransferase n=1 Tax=Phellinidium pouzarii TaxID=167371 RepID=A0A4S4KW50_9AGAM|nr:hypothetical protein EW145_g6660 [Phellinidium pouzarii]
MNLGSELYKLPADKQEMDRLSLQHRIWKLMADGLYPKEAEETVQKALRGNDGVRQPMILDIGSGSGSWAVEMALKFPHAKVIGMDLIQSTPGFVKANITTTLDEYVGQFDVIQCRSVAKHTPLHLPMPSEKHSDQGASFFFADAVTLIYNSDKQPYLLVNPEEGDSADRSWFARWLFEVTERWTTKAQQNTEGDELHILIREDGQFEDVKQKEYYSPVNWDGEDPAEIPNGTEIGKLMVLNILDFLQSTKPSLLSEGLTEDVIEVWSRNVRNEVLEASKRMFMKVASPFSMSEKARRRKVAPRLNEIFFKAMPRPWTFAKLRPKDSPLSENPHTCVPEATYLNASRSHLSLILDYFPGRFYEVMLRTLFVLSGAASLVLAQTISGAFDCMPAGGFTLCQNLWGEDAGVGNQSSTLISASGDTVSWETVWTWANNDNNVKSYANVESNTAKGIQLSNLSTVPTSWSWTYKTQSTGIRADVSYDIWLGPTPDGATASSASAYEIMLISNADSIQPVGSQTTTGISLAGHTWTLWKGPNANWEVLSFVSADGDITDFSADLTDFFDYIVANQGVSTSQFLQAIQTGTEPFVGNADLLINSFSVSATAK